ncbi:hypothetical protein BTN50_0781 [Candidatus Enterovibrio altilux]|uniref:Uncharacterized protein n=1 Tax=Candidatus Enterovibrio altilux TaxID=1927128 RepID=A0A291B8H6_9GAMM|nr:hypothetical protein BTN50_0781 [Candidatus Enterovibrio luxaltus]
MFGISFWKLILSIVIGLVVVGSEKFPPVLRNMFLWMSSVRWITDSMRGTFEHELRIQEQKNNLKKLSR